MKASINACRRHWSPSSQATNSRDVSSEWVRGFSKQDPLAGGDQGSGFPEVVGGAGGDHRGVGNPGLRQLVDRREGPDFRLLPGLQQRGDAPGEVLVAVDDGGQLAGPLPVGELLDVEGVVDADAADADRGDFEGGGHAAAQRKYFP